MDRRQLRSRTLTGQPSPLHTYGPHRLRPGCRGLSGIDEVHSGVHAVVHLAAIPGATFAPNVATFDNNLVSTFHIFQAAKLFKIHNLVWASSETLLGYPFNNPPAYVPLDENVPPTPEVVYALAKDLEEEMAR
jgi:nucleoside-diphosphate-sugar epimerase